MKKIFLFLAVLATTVSCKENKKQEVAVNDVVQVQKTAVANNVDVANSVLNWKGAKPTGHHVGTVKLKEGNLVVKDGVLTSGQFLIDMATIKDSENNGRLEKHLKSSDFFDVEKYPTSKFEITSVIPMESAGNLSVIGNLTIKGTTKSIRIPARISEADGVVTLTSETFKVDRSKFNVRYGSKSFFDNLKNKFIDDMMEMSFVVKTVK